LGKLPLDHQQQLLQKKSTTEKINGYFQKNKVNPQLGKLSHLVKSLYFNYVSPTVISLK